jgi:hypothetical protein
MKSVYIIVQKCEAFRSVFTNLKALYNQISNLGYDNGMFMAVRSGNMTAFGVEDYKMVRLTYDSLVKQMRASQAGGKRYGFIQVYDAYDNSLFEINEATIISK